MAVCQLTESTIIKVATNLGLTNWANSESIRLDSATVATGAALGGSLSVAENAAAGFDSAN